jgi:hypothetical protein
MTVSQPQAQGIGAGQVQRRVLPGVEQAGDQAENLPGLLSAISGRGVHGVLDDPHRDRGAVALAGRLQLRQVRAVRQRPHRPQRERGRGAPQDVRPGRQHGTGQGPRQELPVRSTSIPGPKQPSRSAASGCSASVYRPMAAPSMLPVPDSAAATHRNCGNAPSRDWFDGRPKNAAFLPLYGTSVVVRPSRPPAARSTTPRAPRPLPSARRRARTASAPDQSPACRGPATARRYSAATIAGPALRLPAAPAPAS